jgi:hypothetical protein
MSSETPAVAREGSLAMNNEKIDLIKQDGLTGTDEVSSEKEEWRSDYRFWLILVSLAISCLVCGLENSIIVIPLPFIIQDLDAGANYVWVANIHFLTG